MSNTTVIDVDDIRPVSVAVLVLAWLGWFGTSIYFTMDRHDQPWVWHGQTEAPGWYGPMNPWWLLLSVAGFFSAFPVAAAVGIAFNSLISLIIRWHAWRITYGWATHGEYFPGVRSREFKRIFKPKLPSSASQYHKIALGERAEAENIQWLSGDPLAMYGQFPPHETFRPISTTGGRTGES